MTTMIDIQALDGSGSFRAYRADPASPPKAAIVVIQEVFGVNSGIRRRCDQWAEQGYLALAPDLFWRIEPGVDLDPDIPEQLQKGLSMIEPFDQQLGIADIEATIRFARHALGDGGKVGVVGYCLGGRLAYMTAARTDADATVGYYGVGIDGLLDERHAIANPLILHIPQEDHFVDKEAQARMHAGLDDHPKVTLFDYPGEDHGFATEFGQRRSEESAQLADRRTAEFFETHLG